ncbi:MAG: YheU family protein [Proteobacteria bacterium]|nr:YheU family protein [Pseudomonadota bacterium]
MTKDQQSSPDSGTAYLFIEHSLLQPETLNQLAREFILREYANDSCADHDLDAAVGRAIKRIVRGEYLITFDPETESVGILDGRDPSLRAP